MNNHQPNVGQVNAALTRHFPPRQRPHLVGLRYR